MLWSRPFQEGLLGQVSLSSNINLSETRDFHLWTFSILNQIQNSRPPLSLLLPLPGADVLPEQQEGGRSARIPAAGSHGRLHSCPEHMRQATSTSLGFVGQDVLI